VTLLTEWWIGHHSRSPGEVDLTIVPDSDNVQHLSVTDEQVARYSNEVNSVRVVPQSIAEAVFSSEQRIPPLQPHEGKDLYLKFPRKVLPGEGLFANHDRAVAPDASRRAPRGVRSSSQSMSSSAKARLAG
jgi:hypothetical protein